MVDALSRHVKESRQWKNSRYQTRRRYPYWLTNYKKPNKQMDNGVLTTSEEQLIFPKYNSG